MVILCLTGLIKSLFPLLTDKMLMLQDISLLLDQITTALKIRLILRANQLKPVLHLLSHPILTKPLTEHISYYS